MRFASTRRFKSLASKLSARRFRSKWSRAETKTTKCDSSSSLLLRFEQVQSVAESAAAAAASPSTLLFRLPSLRAKSRASNNSNSTAAEPKVRNFCAQNPASAFHPSVRTHLLTIFSNSVKCATNIRLSGTTESLLPINSCEQREHDSGSF